MSENMAFEEKLRSFLKHYEALEATVGQEGEEGYYKEFMVSDIVICRLLLTLIRVTVPLLFRRLAGTKRKVSKV